MKKTYWMVGIVVFIIASALVYFYYYSQQTNKTKCEFMNSENCDKSCKIDADCKPSFGFCVNINEEVHLPTNVFPAYEIVTCKCENNKCVGIPTGRAAI